MIRLWLGDCNERLGELTEVRAFITDPPYGLEFMGRDWDKLTISPLDTRQPGDPNYTRTSVPLFDRAKVRHSSAESYGGSAHLEMQAWHKQWLEKCYAALVPGGVIKIFSATRTFHRLASAMVEVGFALVPGESLEAWAYGSGFPKNLNISKALDAHLGKTDEREVVGAGKGKGGENLNKIVRSGKGDDEDAQGCGAFGVGAKQVTIDIPITAPVSDEAKRFEGYGTALKPAWEIFLVGRKVAPSEEQTDPHGE